MGEIEQKEHLVFTTEDTGEHREEGRKGKR
jgi:hypothetical protein